MLYNCDHLHAIYVFFYIDIQEIYSHHKHLSWLIRLLSDREYLVKSLTFSVFSSLFESSNNNNECLKLILYKNKEFIDYMFSAIKLSSSTLVRMYSMDCLRLLLNLCINYKINNQNINIDEKYDEKNEEDMTMDLMNLINKYIWNRLQNEIDFTKLLHDVTGNALYFKSVCYLLKTLIICDIKYFKKIPFETMQFCEVNLNINYK